MEDSVNSTNRCNRKRCRRENSQSPQCKKTKKQTDFPQKLWSALRVTQRDCGCSTRTIELIAQSLQPFFKEDVEALNVRQADRTLEIGDKKNAIHYLLLLLFISLMLFFYSIQKLTR